MEYFDSRSGPGQPLNIATFYASRLFRIVPPMFFALALSVVAFAYLYIGNASDPSISPIAMKWWANARVMELPDHTVIPGIIGLHNHTFYYRSTPTSAVQQPYSGPRLYLAGGVTTI